MFLKRDSSVTGRTSWPGRALPQETQGFDGIRAFIAVTLIVAVFIIMTLLSLGVPS